MRPSSALLTAGVVVFGVLVCVIVALILHGSEKMTAERVMDRRVVSAREAVTTEAERYADVVLGAAAGLGAQTELTYDDFLAVTDPVDRMRLRGATGIAYLAETGDGGTETVFRRVLVSSGAPAPVADVDRYPPATDALRRSRGTRGVTASDPFRLGAPPAPLYLIFASTVAQAPGQPDGAFRGWIVLEVRATQFMNDALVEAAHGLLDLTLLATSGGPPVELSAVRQVARTLDLDRAVPVSVADRVWRLRVQARAADLPGGETSLDTIFVLAGLMVTVLLAALVFTLVTGRDRAQAQVRAATAEVREAEREARRHAALLTTVMESIGDGVAVVDEAGDFLMYNPSVHGLFRAANTTTTLSDRTFSVFHPDGSPFPPQEWPLVRAVAGHACDDVEMVVGTPGGADAVCLSVSARPLGPEAGQRGAVAVFHDITELRRLNDRLEQRVRDRTAELADQAERLREANAELEAFSYSVSHDLRAPLRTVDGFARILALDHGHTLNDEGHRYLNKVRSGAQNMSELIDGLLSFSRLQRQPIVPGNVAMTSLVWAVWEDLAAERGERAVDLRVDDLPSATGDPRLIRQVLANLLGNAIKYTAGREEAHIRVSTCSDVDGQVAYEIRDNGVGFDMRYADQLFKVFQRLHRREDYEGTGIGLALTARIVRRHGGRIWAESEPDRGATFRFTLPGEDASA